MGRRRRRVVRIVKKKLPTVFVCPRCGEEAVRVTIAKDTGKAVVMCSQCQLKDEFQAHPAAQMIDVYSFFADRFYGVKDPRPIIPREREMPQVIPEPEEEPPSLLIPEAPSEPSVPETEPAEARQEESAEALPESMGPEPVPEEGASVANPEPPSMHVEEEQKEEMPLEPAMEETEPSREEEEPFADILQNKDKKRYSPNPLPQQESASEQSAE